VARLVPWVAAMTAPYPPDLPPTEVAERRSRDDAPVLLDVREPWERDLADIAGSVHIPMGSIAERMADVPADRDVVVYCHHGVRSRAVVDDLTQQGRPRVANLRGGIDEWSRTVDPDIPRY
jgi:sulfur-carrier protein adenylyltransferase/sulfurtransferase